MKTKDIARITIQNLFRRKTRTLLTVLGVIIGCCSIVIMVSIGIGMKESQEQMLASMGDLTIINVNAPQAGNRQKLDQAALEQIKAIDSVLAVTPKKTLDLGNPKLYAGGDRRFKAEGVPLIGMDMDVLDKFGYTLLEGSYPDARPAALIGQYLEYSFQDSMRPDGHNMISRWGDMSDEWFDETDVYKEPEIPDPYFDAMKQPLTLELEIKEDKKLSFPLAVTGRMKEDNAKGYESSEGIIVPLTFLENLIRDSGLNPKKDTTYETVLVKATGIDKVAQVEQSIKAMGFQTYSMESIRKPLEKEARQKQMMLGGLGGISLFVAAIGITNTMIMSISERTREIGIMKALGCYVKDIRLIFLSEAGAIGLLGGIAGSIISLLISFGMNLAAANGSLSMGDDMGMGAVAKMSVIPVWLIGFAILFSVFIGLGSGYYPANKAVKISALEAIKNE